MFVAADLREGCASQIYREILYRNAMRAKEKKAVIIGFHGLAGKCGGEVREVCCEPLSAVEAQEEDIIEDGIAARVRHEDLEEESLHLFRPEAGILAFPAPPRYAKLVHLPLRRQVLPKRRVALWMRKVSSLIHPANRFLYSPLARARLPTAGIVRRLSDSTICIPSRPRQNSMLQSEENCYLSSE